MITPPTGKHTTILYTYTERRSFVESDLRMLGDVFSVTPYSFQATPKRRTPWSLVRQFFFLLFRGWGFSHFITFFAGYHSLLPVWFARLTGKKSYIILGGTDCFCYPSFRYGNFTRKAYGWFTCASTRWAHRLLPVSSNLIRSHAEYYTGDPCDQGIEVWCRGIRTPFSVVSLEFDTGVFSPRPVARIPDSFITVAFGITGTSFVRKGIDKVIDLARHLPSHPFTIIGCHPADFQVPVPGNVTLIPPVPHRELPEYYSRHTFYLQLSIAEGFPSAICEAMLCACIPVGSAVAALPEIIGDTGKLVHRRDDAAILDAVREAMAIPDKVLAGQAARQRIITRYGERSRIRALIAVLAN